MTNNPEHTPDPSQEGEKEETLAERSARLEAEAAAMAAGNTESDDHLAPTAVEDELYGEADPLDIPEENVAVAALQKELDEAKDKMIRAVAEAENARKRAQKEREDARKFAVTGFSKDIITVADNLRRALEAVPEELLAEQEQVKALVDGIAATERELLRAFEKNGIKKLTPDLDKGEVFDPNIHEVMFEAPGTGQPAGTIIQVMEPGYTLNDRLIRPARVGVAKDEGGGHPPEGVHIDTEA